MAFASCLPSPSLFVLVRLLPQDDLSLYLYLHIFYCACIFNFLEIYAQVLVCIGSVPAYLIPEDICTSYVLFLLTCMGSMLACSILEDMCISSVLSLLSCTGSVLGYSIPRGYVHNFLVFSDLQRSPWWKIH